jgi:hypothetical protein
MQARRRVATIVSARRVTVSTIAHIHACDRHRAPGL